MSKKEDTSKVKAVAVGPFPQRKQSKAKPAAHPKPEPEQEAAKEPRVARGKTVEQPCPVRLTDPELLDFGRRLSQALAEAEAAEDDLAAYKSQIKARIDSAKASAGRFKACIETGVEYRILQCYEELDFEARTVSVVRPDTMETVGFPREMNEREAQRELPLETELDPKAVAALLGDDTKPEQPTGRGDGLAPVPALEGVK